MRERLKDEDKRAIRALELDGLTQRQLLQRLTKRVAEMDRLANEDDPTAGPLAEWAPAARAMFGNLTKPELVGAILDHEELVEPAAAYRRSGSRSWPFGSPWIHAAVRCFEIAATWSSCRQPRGTWS